MLSPETIRELKALNNRKADELLKELNPTIFDHFDLLKSGVLQEITDPTSRDYVESYLSTFENRLKEFLAKESGK